MRPDMRALEKQCFWHIRYQNQLIILFILCVFFHTFPCLNSYVFIVPLHHRNHRKTEIQIFLFLFKVIPEIGIISMLPSIKKCLNIKYNYLLKHFMLWCKMHRDSYEQRNFVIVLTQSIMRVIHFLGPWSYEIFERKLSLFTLLNNNIFVFKHLSVYKIKNKYPYCQTISVWQFH